MLNRLERPHDQVDILLCMRKITARLGAVTITFDDTDLATPLNDAYHGGVEFYLIQHLPLFNLITLQMLVGPVTGRGKFEYILSAER